MKGLLADVNCVRHLQVLRYEIESGPHKDIWASISLPVHNFQQLQLGENVADRELWAFCQERELLLITGNRNEHGESSLGLAIRELGTASSLPVVTLGNPQRVLSEKTYRACAANDLVEILFDIDLFRGCGRLYIPRSGSP